jgi:glucokinase
LSDRQLLDAIDDVTGSLLRRPASTATTAVPELVRTHAAELLGAAEWVSFRDGQVISSPGAGCVVGLDLGGTKLRGALCDCGGRILLELEQPTVNTAPDSALPQMIEMVRDLARQSGVALDMLEGVAVGVPGVVDDQGRVALSPNVAFDRQTPLAQTLEAATAVPVSVDNDGNLSAFGEYTAGRGRSENTHSLAFLALGTGVGMGLIVDGHLLHGRSGGAGEIAFLPFGTDPFSSAAANPAGSFEAAVGSEAIRFSYKELSGKDARVREIFERAEAGDAGAARVVERTLRDIAMGVGAVIALLDPGIVVMGGGIGARPGVAEAIGKLTATLVPSQCRVVASALGDRAGVVGALAYAREQAKLRLIDGRAARSRGAAA